MNYKNIYKPKDVKALSELLHNSTEKKFSFSEFNYFYYEKGKENKILTMQFFKIFKDEDCFFLKLSDDTIFDFNEISYFYDKESKTFAFVQLAELVNSQNPFLKEQFFLIVKKYKTILRK